jgi:hypothetical protein
MRAPYTDCLFTLSLLLGTPALSRSAEPGPAGKSAEEIQAIKKQSVDWLTSCLTDWDSQTHMTKDEWRTTCERVSREREDFYLNTPGSQSVGERALRGD